MPGNCDREVRERLTAKLSAACCDVVPTIYRGDFINDAVTNALEDLRTNGSKAAPGFMKPEGIVVYHTACRQYFKKTIEKDEEPKGKWAVERVG